MSVRFIHVIAWVSISFLLLRNSIPVCGYGNTLGESLLWFNCPLPQALTVSPAQLVFLHLVWIVPAYPAHIQQ